jgi:O-antigen ligase
MRRSREPGGLARAFARAALLLLLVAAPLALGSVHPMARRPFLTLAGLAGIVSWAGARWGRSRGQAVPAVPGWRLLLALNLLVLFQLVPLPPALLRVLSPVSHEFYRVTEREASPGTYWPVTLSPSRTSRGLLFLAALSLVYGAAFREFGEPRRARWVATTIVCVAATITLVGFIQRASPHPGTIYGLWEPALTHTVFGPYVNRSHYAGYAVMAIPLALALAAGSLHEARRRWRYSGVGVLGEGAVTSFALYSTLALFIVAGVLSAGSRIGVIAAAASALAIPLAFGRRAVIPLGVVAAVTALSLLFVDVDWFLGAISGARLETDRVVAWRDMLKIVPDAPIVGVGWNAFGLAYRWRYQTVYEWGLWDQAHNEYLQVLFDTGAVGCALVAVLLFRLAGHALRAASHGGIGVGLLGALVANAATNLADFNLQIPANAATFAAIAGLTLALGGRFGTPSADATDSGSGSRYRDG